MWAIPVLDSKPTHIKSELKKSRSNIADSACFCILKCYVLSKLIYENKQIRSSYFRENTLQQLMSGYPFSPALKPSKAWLPLFNSTLAFNTILLNFYFLIYYLLLYSLSLNNHIATQDKMWLLPSMILLDHWLIMAFISHNSLYLSRLVAHFRVIQCYDIPPQIHTHLIIRVLSSDCIPIFCRILVSIDNHAISYTQISRTPNIIPNIQNYDEKGALALADLQLEKSTPNLESYPIDLLYFWSL